MSSAGERRESRRAARAQRRQEGLEAARARRAERQKGREVKDAPRGAGPQMTLGAMPAAAAAAEPWRATRFIVFGAVLTVGLVIGIGAWSAVAMISGAVIAPAELRVEGDRKTIQHLEGGVVSEILIKEGDTVEAGEVLMRLDPTALAAQIEVIDGQLDELTARKIRLEAEMTDAEAMSPGAEFEQRMAARPTARRLYNGQISLFDARRETMKSRIEQLEGRVEQTGEEIGGAQAQIAALDRQLELIDEELEAQRSLLARGLTEKSKVIQLDRENARLSGERGQLQSEVARLRGRISELQINILETANTRREEAISTLRDLSARIAELSENRTAKRQSLDRIDIRAPLAGVVLDMTVNTIGGVVSPAADLLDIVPTERTLIVEARISPLDRDRIWPNQAARVRFVNFNQRSTPEIDGAVWRIGADKLTDERSGQGYFPVQIRITDEEFDRLKQSIDTELVPGLPAEVHIQTGERSAASYLLKPLTDQLQRAFRED